MRVELGQSCRRAANMIPGRDPVERIAGTHVRRRHPDNVVDRFMAVRRKWDVLATVIGEVTEGDRLQITW